MLLPRGGAVWACLLWYGYEERRLEGGISLCQAFWSLVVGLPAVYVWRWLAAWMRWIGRGNWALACLKAFTVPGSVATISYLFGGREALLWVVAAMAVIVAIAMAVTIIAGVIIGSCHLFDRTYTREYIGEFAQVLKARTIAAKHHVCPVIRFQDVPQGDSIARAPQNRTGG